MTRVQRRRHLRIWLVLGPLLLIGLSAALLNRSREPMRVPATRGIAP